MRSTGELDRLATRQHGVVTREQVVAAGVSAGMVKRWLADGQLTTLHRGVYRLAGTPATWHQRVMAAVLGGGEGALASHRSAARLWGLHDDEAVEITVPSGRRRRLAGVVVHRQEDPPAPFRRNGIPVTDPMRTLVDLGAVLGAGEVEDALDRALSRRLLSVAGVEHALDAVARPGRDGAGVLRAVLDQRALGAERPDGLLEPRMARLLRRHGLPPAVYQFVVRHNGRFVARVDFAYPAQRIIIEVDGFETHSSPRALQDDLERQNQLMNLGWVVLRFTWADVVLHPERVANHVRRALAGREQAPLPA